MNNLIQESVIKFSESFQLPEKIIHADDLPWIPYDDETCQFKPLRFDLTTGNWTYLFKIKGSTVIGRHRHTGGNVIGYNLQGHWRYKDRDWVAKPGSFIFEPPGDIHTLITEGEEDVITLFILGGHFNFSMMTTISSDKTMYLQFINVTGIIVRSRGFQSVKI